MIKYTKSQRTDKAAANLKQIWKDYKAKTGKTQEIVATELGMRQPHFSQYINGHVMISLDLLFRFMEYFEIEAKDIYDEFE